MGLIEWLKSKLGLDASGAATGGSSGEGSDAGVHVERELGREPDPETGAEDAVKGTDTATTDTAAPETASATGDAEPTEAEEGSAESGGDAPESEASGQPTDAVKGIGPAYAERLSGAGVETVADLAAADASALAEETDIAESRIENWIERATEA